MKTTEIEADRANLKRTVLSVLERKVFHVTNRKGYEGIVSSGAIKPNINCRFGRNWGWDCETFFREKGCVSVCDLYHNSDKQKVRKAIEKYYFLDLPCNKGETYYLILSPELYNKLIPWSDWHKEKAYNKTVVPYLEAGFPGEIPLSEIVEIIKVSIRP